MSRCKGITRVGKHCSVTSSSNWIDDHGRLVAGPLQKGGEIQERSQASRGWQWRKKSSATLEHM